MMHMHYFWQNLTNLPLFTSSREGVFSETHSGLRGIKRGEREQAPVLLTPPICVYYSVLLFFGELLYST